MGKAMVVYKIYPEDGKDINELMEELKKNQRVKDIKKEPIAFGLEVIKIGVIIDDKKENPEEIEKEIRQTQGIKEMETEGVTLIS
jgi:translation elongation factor EF-1beta